MRLSANMVRLYDLFGIRGTLDLFAEAGFAGMDFNNDVAEYHTDAHGEDFYRELAAYAASPPFPRAIPRSSGASGALRRSCRG